MGRRRLGRSRSVLDGGGGVAPPLPLGSSAGRDHWPVPARHRAGGRGSGRSYPPGHLSPGSGGDCAGQPTAAGGAGCGRRARCHGRRAARPAAPGAGGARPAGEAGRGHRGALPAPPLRRVAAPLRHCRGRAAPYRLCVPGPARAGWRPGAGAAAAPPADLPRERCRTVAASLRGAPRPAARPPAGRAGGDRIAVATPAGRRLPAVRADPARIPHSPAAPAAGPAGPATARPGPDRRGGGTGPRRPPYDAAGRSGRTVPYQSAARSGSRCRRPGEHPRRVRRRHRGLRRAGGGAPAGSAVPLAAGR